MSTYKYEAVDKKGQETSGSVDAENQAHAVRLIKSMGYFPTHVSSAEEKGQAKRGRTGRSLKTILSGMSEGKVKTEDLVAFTRQLATLVGAGVPLVKSLGVLQDQLQSGKMKKALEKVSDQVSSGSTFSDALSSYPKIFTSLFLNTVRAGEAAGILEVVLNRLADFMEKGQQTAQKIKGALAYPIVVVCVCVTVLLFIMLFVVPKFMSLFQDIGASLPLPTVILISLTDIVVKQWYVVIAGIIAAVIAYKLFYRIQFFRYYIDRFRLKAPIVGELIQKMAIARFSRTLGTLISSGVPILQALLIAKDTSENEAFKRAIDKVHDSIREGESISAPLQASGIFPPMVVSMIGVGEESGSLDQMLNKVADSYENEVDHVVSALTSMLEPVLIIGMGSLVGFIVMAMFMPLVKLMTALSM